MILYIILGAVFSVQLLTLYRLSVLSKDVWRGHTTAAKIYNKLEEPIKLRGKLEDLEPVAPKRFRGHSNPPPARPKFPADRIERYNY